MSTITRLDTPNVTLPYDGLAELCRRFGVLELSVFGSALGRNFGPESDVDFLVVFQNDDAGPWMQKLQDMEEAAALLIGRKAQMVLKRSVETSWNYIRRRDILDHAKVIYVA